MVIKLQSLGHKNNALHLLVLEIFNCYLLFISVLSPEDTCIEEN